MGPRVFLALHLLAVAVSPSLGEDPEAVRYVLTLEEARELARSRAPRLLAARTRIEAARGERLGVAVWQPSSPELAVAAGPRRRDGDKLGTDVDVSIGQRFELGGRRRARVERADAGIVRATAAADDAARELLRDVSASFLATLHADASLEVARESEQLFGEIRRVTERRYEAGDVGILDPYAAATAHARSRARLAEVEALRALTVAELRAMLGLEEAAVIVVEGELEHRPRVTLETLLERAVDRPDLRTLDAELERARAEQQLARGYRSPELGAFVRYGREEEADVYLGGLSIALPVRGKSQARTAVAEAEQRALQVELRAARSVVASEVRSRFEAFSILDAAATQFASDALPRLEQMLELARRSYEAGNIPFAELLVLQRETVEARQAYLDLLLQAALAGTDLEAAAGVL